MEDYTELLNLGEFKMSKKYRLIIPEMIRSKDGYLAEHALNNNVGKTFDSISFYPEDWFQEIEEEPITAEEFVKNYDWNNQSRNLDQDAIAFYKAGDKNGELRTELKYKDLVENLNRLFDAGQWAWPKELLSLIK